jgi:hypothetical protein
VRLNHCDNIFHAHPRCCAMQYANAVPESLNGGLAGFGGVKATTASRMPEFIAYLLISLKLMINN